MTYLTRTSSGQPGLPELKQSAPGTTPKKLILSKISHGAGNSGAKSKDEEVEKNRLVSSFDSMHRTFDFSKIQQKNEQALAGLYEERKGGH